MSKRTVEIKDVDREQIAKLIREGYTSGIFDSNGFSINWVLVIDKWDNQTQ